MVPIDIRVHNKSKVLELRYEGDVRHELTFEYLRVHSPSAEVRGHGEGQRTLQTGKKYVGVDHIEPMGNYAIKISFDDGHETGIYTWEYLLELAERREQYWSEYLQELKTANASRLPNIASFGVGQWQPEQD